MRAQERVRLARFEVTEGIRENRCACTTNASDSCFTGKEEDIDVGLTYFGKRYLSPYLNRWISADPLAVHGLGADLNLYAYVSGRALQAIDPVGLDEDTLSSDPANLSDQKSGEEMLAAKGNLTPYAPGKKAVPQRAAPAPAPDGSKSFSGGGGTPSKTSGSEGAGGGPGNFHPKTDVERFQEGEREAFPREIHEMSRPGLDYDLREWRAKLWSDRPIQPEVGDRLKRFDFMHARGSIGRASDSKSEGWGFESLRACHYQSLLGTQ